MRNKKITEKNRGGGIAVLIIFYLKLLKGLKEKCFLVEKIKDNDRKLRIELSKIPIRTEVPFRACPDKSGGFRGEGKLANSYKEKVLRPKKNE